MTSETGKRRRAQRKGHWSEWLAATYLLARGYRIVDLRYKTKLGEIDIIARKGDLVAMIEVKARKSVSAAVDAVSYSSQRRIRGAADMWLSGQPDASRLSIRFDIIAVLPWRIPVQLEDAF